MSAGAAAAGPAGAAATARRIVAATLAAAAAVLHAFRVRQLVAETTLEPAAQTRKLRRVQAEILLFGHLDGDRLKRLEERRATEGAAAGAVPADQLGLVPHTDLAHLDSRAKLGRELTDEIAKVHAAFGREIEDQPGVVERLLDPREFHGEASLANLQE